MQPLRRRQIPRAPAVIHIDPRDVAPTAGGDPLKEAAMELAQKLMAQLRAGAVKLPMLPGAAQQMMDLARRPDVTLRELEDVLTLEPGISAQVLRLASSPYYARGGRITSLRGAVQRLGSGTLRDLLFQAVTDAHLFHGDARLRLHRRRAHALACAHAAKITCQRLGIDGEYAFLCGLLHDLGEVLALRMITPQDYPDLTHAQRERVVHAVHTALGERVARAWSLPGLVIEAITRHHRYREGSDTPYSQIGNVIAVADLVSAHLAAHVTPRAIDLTHDAALFELGLAPEDIEAVVRGTQEALEMRPDPRAA